MTPITKAENKVEALKLQVSGLTPSHQKAAALAIEKMTELVDLYVYRKRKTEKDQMDDLYTVFVDEFNVIYVDIVDKLGISETGL